MTTRDTVPGRIVAAVGSLRVTVVLLGLALFLVFAGTLAQRFQGIWSVMEQYFRCWLAWVDAKVFYPSSVEVRWGFPFPGGFLIGTALLINLLVSHARRIQVQARGPRLWMGLAVLAIGSVLTWLVISHVFDADSSEKKIDPFWRVTMQLVQGTGVAVVLFWGCRMVFGRKAGIVLLHGGIVLMMISELITAKAAVEGRMRISEGSYRNYVFDTRETELAVVDGSDPASDRVTVVPERMYEHGGKISSPELPFDIEIPKDRWFVNADPAEGDAAKDAAPNPATAGVGLHTPIRKLKESTSEAIDLPACYATLLEKGSGTPIGTWLLWTYFTYEGGGGQKVEVGGKTYEIALRFKRTYKPYEIHLKEFEASFYDGTRTPKDFSAYVRLVDAERGVDRDVRIWMNNPLRYRSDTLYQSSWDGGPAELTELQVVTNVGWMVPYVGCMIVAVGLLGQFSMHLLGFLRGRREEAA